MADGAGPQIVEAAAGWPDVLLLAVGVGICLALAALFIIKSHAGISKLFFKDD